MGSVRRYLCPVIESDICQNERWHLERSFVELSMINFEYSHKNRK